uniref:Uncharacterized protein n=1 Tax=Ananas comosus var. bracteatus TaxID=296719 RepID=A0A6V7PEF6_ANACO|nr:unnamed protein product [Ananas comosus var. bracteatus]
MAPMRHYVRRSVPAQPAEVPEQAGSSEVQELPAQMTALDGVVQRQGSLIERLQERLERLVAAAAATAIEGRGPPVPSIRALNAAEAEEVECERKAFEEDRGKKRPGGSSGRQFSSQKPPKYRVWSGRAYEPLLPEGASPAPFTTFAPVAPGQFGVPPAAVSVGCAMAPRQLEVTRSAPSGRVVAAQLEGPAEVEERDIVADACRGIERSSIDTRRVRFRFSRTTLAVVLGDDLCLDHLWTVEPGPFGQAQSVVSDSSPIPTGANVPKTLRTYVRSSTAPAVPERSRSEEVQELREQIAAMMGAMQRQETRFEQLQGFMELQAAAAATAAESRDPPAPSARAGRGCHDPRPPAYLAEVAAPPTSPNGQGFPCTTDRVSPVHPRRRNQHNTKVISPTKWVVVIGLDWRVTGCKPRVKLEIEEELMD